MLISESDIYGSEKIRIPASRTLDIIGLLLVIIFLVMTGYPVINGSSIFSSEIVSSLDAAANGNIAKVLFYINSIFPEYPITKDQLVFFVPFLLIMFATIKYIEEFLKNDSGLVIDKMGITYTPTILRAENEGEYRTPITLEWNEIDSFVIEQEINTRVIKFPFLRVYLNPETLKKTKTQKLIGDIAAKIAEAVHINTSAMRPFHDLKGLNADINQLKKLLDKRLSDFRSKNLA